MLPPQLRQGVTLTGQRASLPAIRVRSTWTAFSFTPNPIPVAQQHRQWSLYKKGRNWESELDPSYGHFLRRRHMRTKAELKDSLRRMSKWDMPLPAIQPWGTRHASHWSKYGKEWQYFGEESKKKSRPENADSYELSPGEKRWKKQMETMREYIQDNPYRAVFGKPLDPFWGTSMWGPLLPSWLKPDIPHTNSAQAPEVLQSDKSNTRTSDSAQGGNPKSTKKADVTTTPYARTSSFTMHTSRQSGKQPVMDASASSWDSRINQTTMLKYDPVSNRMVTVVHPEGAAASEVEGTHQLQGNAHDSVGDTVDVPVKTFRGPAVNVNSRPDAEPVTEVAEPPEVEQLTKIAAKLDKLPRNDIDLLTADDVRATMGKVRHQKKDEKQARENRLAALERDFYEKEQAATRTIDDTRQALAELRKGVAQKAQFAQASGSSGAIQTALDRMNAQKKMQEKPTEGVNPDDGYSHRPIGLQTAYRDEMTACSSGSRKPLSKEIQEKPSEGLDFNDGYSRFPLGLQTSYAQDQNGRWSLEGDLAANAKAAQDAERGLGPQYDDGYDSEPSGLQTSYAQEREHGGPTSLESELSANAEAVRDAERGLTPQYEDGYSQEPSGLQTLFAKECEQGGCRLLEQELAANDKAVQDAERGLTPQAEDGFTKEPTGLERSYQQERQACKDGQTPSLEQELKSKTTTKSQAYNDHYDRSPIGLQILYKQEHEAAQDGKRQSLEEELKSKQRASANAMLSEEVEAQKNAMRAHEGSLASMSMPAGQQRVEAMQAEGDMCSNVAKYADSSKWYKQTNREAQSKDSKAGVRSAELERQIDAISKENNLYGSSFDADLVDTHVERGLSEYDQKKGMQYRFKADGLEQELMSQGPVQAASSTATSQIPPRADIASEIAWAEPALYKVLAYDSGNDILRAATTSANFSDNEGPMSISHALSQLYQPARFVPHFASLQSDGFQVISASRDLLVFRKVKPLEKEVDETTPTQSEMNRQQAELDRSKVNPVDGMTRPQPQAVTGNYASPTGFVNYDPVIPDEPPVKPTSEASTGTTNSAQHMNEDIHDEDMYYRHYPRVYRQEPVFSGSRYRRGGRHGDYEEAYRDGRFNSNGGIKKNKRRGQWRQRIRFALSVGACTALSVYAIGVGAELARGDKSKDREI